MVNSTASPVNHRKRWNRGGKMVEAEMRKYHPFWCWFLSGGMKKFGQVRKDSSVLMMTWRRFFSGLAGGQRPGPSSSWHIDLGLIFWLFRLKICPIMDRNCPDMDIPPLDLCSGLSDNTRYCLDDHLFSDLEGRPFGAGQGPPWSGLTSSKAMGAGYIKLANN